MKTTSDLSNLELTGSVDLANTQSYSNFTMTDWLNRGNPEKDKSKFSGTKNFQQYKNFVGTKGFQQYKNFVGTKGFQQYKNIQGEDLDNQMSSITGVEIEKLWRESKTQLGIKEWIKTDEGKKAIATEVHKATGSNQPILDWLKSDSAKQLLTNATSLATLALASKTNANTTTGSDVTTNQYNLPPTSNKPSETTIFGMNPVTFGIVAVITLVGVGISAKYLIK